jgi:lysophospholipase L1-like esterase
MHRPLHTLLFGVSVFTLLAAISLLFPDAGITANGLPALEFAKLGNLLGREKENAAALTAIRNLEQLDSAESRLPDGKEQIIKKDSVRLNTNLQMTNAGALDKFFEALKKIASFDSPVHVLHYGDSQIEGDRISDFLRQKLQGRFGGGGPGLVSFMPVSPTMLNKITGSAGWDRYTVFTIKDARVNHSNFGVMGAFCRFAPEKVNHDTTVKSTLSITTTKFGGPTAMQYNKIRLFYGGAKKRTWCELYDGPALAGADSLDAGGSFNVKDFPVTKGSTAHVFSFTGKDSPDFYGMSLEGSKGIMVDNIPLRGSSGTFFHQINSEQLKRFYTDLNCRLIILQFGGNAMPAIKDATGAANYGGYIRYQLTVIKKLAPAASILFIGPSDMSAKEGTAYSTVPFLEETRDAIRKAVLENGCAFFDMYDCMGGRNSMPVWVEQKLAATDYTHFSPQGARKIAVMLHAALNEAYTKYLERKK